MRISRKSWLLAPMRSKLATRNLRPLNSTVRQSTVLIIHLDNLTKEKYSGVSKRAPGVLSVSRDTLNPLLNTETLQGRLQDIEYFRNRGGVERNYWPHFAMQRMFRHLNRYKFNYAVKGAVVFMLYRDYQALVLAHRTEYVTRQKQVFLTTPMLWHGGILAALCAFM